MFFTLLHEIIQFCKGNRFYTGKHSVKSTENDDPNRFSLGIREGYYLQICILLVKTTQRMIITI